MSSDLPNMPAEVSEMFAAAQRHFAKHGTAKISPAPVAQHTGVPLRTLIEQLNSTGGAPFYMGCDLVGQWDEPAALLTLTRTN